MTNGEKYKTFDERRKAHGEYCNKMADTPKCIAMHNSCGCAYCALEWLGMEAEGPMPMPCPFCGCSEIKIRGNNDLAFVQCAKCGIETGWRISKNDAIEAWNRRVK